MMNRKWPALLLLLVLLAACSNLIPPPQDNYELVTLTPLASPTAAAAPPPGAEGIGLAFFRAWEAQDYAGMYSLLSPQSQALVSQESFTQLYQQSMTTAGAQAVHVQPLAARQDGARAELSVRVIWETVVLGQIVRDHTAELAFGGDRWGVVWHDGLILPELAGGNRLSIEYRVPARGNIYDSQGRGMAYQGAAVTLGVIPGQIADENGLLMALSPLLRLPPDEIKPLYASAQPTWYVPLGDISEDEMRDNYTSLEPFLNAGLTTQGHLTRLYEQGGVAPHVVGYIGFISAERLEEFQALGYTGDERVGLAGVEGWGERYLSGTRGGVLSVISPNGELVGTVQESHPKPARSIYTTLDREFQAAVEQALADAVLSHPLAAAGSIVVMEVDSGAILAMASYPDYDPALFDSLRPDAAQELGELLNDPGRPLLNRVTQGEYPAGSTFKIVSMAAALNSGLYTPETTYTSTGTWDRLGPEYVKFDWREGGHGTLTLRQALTASCNSCFYNAGYNLDEADPYLLPNTARQFGLGERTGITGLTAEAAGLMPDPEWKLATQGEGWARGDAVNMVIGQGFVLLTPLQMVNFVAAVANGGTLYQPTLIDRLGEGGGAPEEEWPAAVRGQLPLSPEHLEAIRQAMLAAANSNLGTATHRFVGLPVPVAGKTGTAETVIAGPHAWFAGYAPAAPYTRPDGTVIERPQIAIVVQMEYAGEGSDVAAPIFRRIVELFYGIAPLTPYPW